ncbi:hypothetical protein AVEN_172148-1, partial [Araneus ventricosus]
SKLRLFWKSKTRKYQLRTNLMHLGGEVIEYIDQETYSETDVEDNTMVVTEYSDLENHSELIPGDPDVGGQLEVTAQL